MSNYILVTGAAGFIGFHLCKKLIKEGFNLIGLDNLNTYYDVDLKKSRLSLLDSTQEEKAAVWKFFKVDLVDKDSLVKIFKQYEPKIVINLAAQAGVRYSIENPSTYIQSNLVGFYNILECCRSFKVEKFLYASSSSVYGGNIKVPYSEKDPTNHPVSLYAATKRSNELLAHSYSHLYDIPSIGLRFFTVYGPWGRPDMAPMKFTKLILSKEPIMVYNFGKMSRSFTYIDDVIELVFRLLKKPFIKDENFDKNKPNAASSWAPHRILNIGSVKNVKLLEFIEILEKELGIKAIKELKPMQLGDVMNTSANCDLITKTTGQIDLTSIEKGVKKFVEWYKDYYNH
tara:strand:+ start:2057 stop:3085 length:1029 start_codon:yes stop_codon:yes gene_type:complete